MVTNQGYQGLILVTNHGYYNHGYEPLTLVRLSSSDESIMIDSLSISSIHHVKPLLAALNGF